MRGNEAKESERPLSLHSTNTGVGVGDLDTENLGPAKREGGEKWCQYLFQECCVESINFSRPTS